MNNRRRLEGTVKSNKMDKTVMVEVSRTYQHPLYHKVVRTHKNYKVHDELGCNVGDKVTIVESAPISRTVRWVVEEILKVEIRQEGVATVVETVEQAEPVVELVEEVLEAAEEAVEEAVEAEEALVEELVETSAEVEEEDAK